MTFAHAVLPAPGPIGALTVGATADGLALVAFGDHPERAAQAAARIALVPPAAVAATPGGGDARAVLDRAVGELREYLDGTRTAFDVPVDWCLTAGTGRTVLRALHGTVAFGRTVTYGELAARSGLGTAHTAARGVGSIMGSNPVPVVVPCHRVLGADGLGGFGGGRATKEWLLALEGVLPAAFDF